MYRGYIYMRLIKLCNDYIDSCNLYYLINTYNNNNMFLQIGKFSLHLIQIGIYFRSKKILNNFFIEILV